MRKHLVVAALYACAALLIVLVASVKISDLHNGNLLAAIGIQNIASLDGTAASSADGAGPASTTATLAYVLQQFQNQIQYLNGQVADLNSKVEIANLNGIFTRTLKKGDTGNDVSKLQELLTRFPGFYSSDATDVDVSSTVTGFYGSLTKAAIMQFQSEEGLRETGIFDQTTKENLYEALNSLANDSASTSFRAMDVSSVAFTADGSPNQTGSANASISDLQSQISQLASDLGNAKAAITDLQSQLVALQETSSVAPAFVALTPALASTSMSAAATTTTMPPPAFTISGVQAVNITKASSTITWTTSSYSTSEVDYSTSSTLASSQTFIVSSSSMAVNHSMVLARLNSGTKYYYRAMSRDGTGNIAGSIIQSFTTLSQ